MGTEPDPHENEGDGFEHKVTQEMRDHIEKFSAEVAASPISQGPRKGHKPHDGPPALLDPTVKNIRQAAKRANHSKGTPPGRARTASLEETYGSLVKAGIVRIVRKKGKPPKIVWLDT